MARPPKNNAEYFSHDADCRNDPRIKAVRRKYGLTGYAIWCMLLEILTDQDHFCMILSPMDLEILAGDFDIDPDQLAEIIEYFITLNLIQKEGDKIWSERHHERMEPLIAKRKRRRSGVMDVQNPISKVVSDMQNPQSKVKESKVKESKVNTTKVVSALTPQKNEKSVSKELERLRNFGGENYEMAKHAAQKSGVNFEDAEMAYVSHCAGNDQEVNAAHLLKWITNEKKFRRTGNGLLKNKPINPMNQILNAKLD